MSCTSSRTSSSGAVSPRIAHAAGHPGDRDQPRDGREHHRLHDACRRCSTRSSCKLAWDDAKRTFDMSRAVTTPTRKAAEFLERTIDIEGVIPISCGIDKRNYTPDLTPRDAPPRAVRRPADHREARRGHPRGRREARPRARHRPSTSSAAATSAATSSRPRTQLGLARPGHLPRAHRRGRAARRVSRADVFAIASIAELQSIATMEAMASGLPIVAANAVALPHLVHDGENGYLFEPGNADDLADKLPTVLTACARGATCACSRHRSTASRSTTSSARSTRSRRCTAASRSARVTGRRARRHVRRSAPRFARRRSGVDAAAARFLERAGHTVTVVAPTMHWRRAPAAVRNVAIHRPAVGADHPRSRVLA